MYIYIYIYITLYRKHHLINNTKSTLNSYFILHSLYFMLFADLSVGVSSQEEPLLSRRCLKGDHKELIQILIDLKLARTFGTHRGTR